jgi:hypothetical protein
LLLFSLKFLRTIEFRQQKEGLNSGIEKGRLALL